MSSCIQPPYEILASEYYDSERHPTCANFRELSATYLASQLSGASSQERMVEVGAGRSLAAEILSSKIALKNLVITDQSPAMLRHSAHWTQQGALVQVVDARQLSVQFSGLDVIIASLADPYNDAAFWRSAFQSLGKGGRVVCTLPAFEWAHSFRMRAALPQDVAEFLTANGSTHLVPSFVPQLARQIGMMENAGLVVQNFQALSLTHLSTGSQVSPKLLVANRSPASLVWGLAASRLE